MNKKEVERFKKEKEKQRRKEKRECETKGITCEYGICDECSVYGGKENEESRY